MSPSSSQTSCTQEDSVYMGQALALAANQQLLRDPGRTVAQPNKPIGTSFVDLEDTAFV